MHSWIFVECRVEGVELVVEFRVIYVDFIGAHADSGSFRDVRLNQRA